MLVLATDGQTHCSLLCESHLEEHEIKGFLVDSDHIALDGPCQQGGLL